MKLKAHIFKASTSAKIDKTGLIFYRCLQKVFWREKFDAWLKRNRQIKTITCVL